MSLLGKMEGLSFDEKAIIINEIVTRKRAADPCTNDQPTEQARSLLDAVSLQLQQLQTQQKTKNLKENLECDQGSLTSLRSTAGDLKGLWDARRTQGIQDQLQMAIEENPTGVTETFYEIYLVMKEMVEMALRKLGSCSRSVFTVEEDSSPPDRQEVDTCTAIMEEIQVLSVESQKHEVLKNAIEQLIEQYSLFIEKQKEVNNGITISESDNDIQEKSTKEIQKLTETLTMEIFNKRLELVTSLQDHLLAVNKVQEKIICELDQWVYYQRQGLSGWPSPQFLDDLQPMQLFPRYKLRCEGHVELLCKLHHSIEQMNKLFKDAIQNNEVEMKRMDNLKVYCRDMIYNFLNKSFLIEKHPPQVLKANFKATIRHLAGRKLNGLGHPPVVTCALVSEKTVLSWNENKCFQPPTNTGDILNNKKAMEYSQQKNTFCVEFTNLRLKKANRQEGKKDEKVCEQKDCLVFFTKIDFRGETFPIVTLSHPMVVTLNANQISTAEATVLWDNAFAAQDRAPFEVPDRVSWPQLAEALNYRWAKQNGRGLNKENLDYLATKLFQGVTSTEDHEHRYVTKQMLYKDHLHGRKFTFWKWFYDAMSLVNKCMSNEWRDGSIYGFINKYRVWDLLIGQPHGTFLLRFSDSEPGCVTLATRTNQHLMELAVKYYDLWTSQNLSAERISDRIKDLQVLIYLYPSMKTKGEAFGYYYSKQDDEAPRTKDDYCKTKLVTVEVTGASGLSTPLQQSPPHPGSHGQMEITDASAAFTSPQSLPVNSSQCLPSDINCILTDDMLNGFGDQMVQDEFNGFVDHGQSDSLGLFDVCSDYSSQDISNGFTEQSDIFLNMFDI